MKVLNVNMSLDPVTGEGTVERTFQISKSLAKTAAKYIAITSDLGLTPERIKAMGKLTAIALPCLFRRFYVPKFHVSRIISHMWYVLPGHFRFMTDSGSLKRFIISSLLKENTQSKWLWRSKSNITIFSKV